MTSRLQFQVLWTDTQALSRHKTPAQELQPLVPAQVGSQAAGYTRAEEQPRQTHVWSYRLQAFPEQERSKTTVTYRDLSLFIISMRMCTSSIGEMSNKAQICLREEGRVRDWDHVEAEAP